MYELSRIAVALFVLSGFGVCGNENLRSVKTIGAGAYGAQGKLNCLWPFLLTPIDVGGPQEIEVAVRVLQQLVQMLRNGRASLRRGNGDSLHEHSEVSKSHG